MKLLAWLTETFIATFGITRPPPEQQRAAQIIIGGAILTFMVLVAAVAIFLLTASHPSSPSYSPH